MTEPVRYDAGVHYDDPIVRYDSFLPDSPAKSMNTNKISAVFSTADQTTALGHITALNTLLTFLQGLTTEQRKRLNKAANGRAPFIQQAYTYAQQHPEVVPGTFNMTEFGKDVALINALQPFFLALTSHYEKVRDTLTLANSDGYEQALDIYSFFKSSNRNGEYDAILAALGTFFEKTTAPAAPPTP